MSTLNLPYPEEKRPLFLDGEGTDYLISNYGYIESTKVTTRDMNGSHVLKPHITETGYNVVCLYHNDKKYWKTIHRLVAEAFIPIPERYIDAGYSMADIEVNHIDGTREGKSKNYVSNLEWLTSSENKEHAYRTKLRGEGEDHPESIYTAKQIHEVCKLLQEDKLANREIWKTTGVSVTTIQAILSGMQWKSISKDYDFSNHHKRHRLYTNEELSLADELLRTTDLPFKDIGDLAGMTRNAVWALNKKRNIRK